MADNAVWVCGSLLLELTFWEFWKPTECQLLLLHDFFQGNFLRYYMIIWHRKGLTGMCCPKNPKP